MTAVALLAQLRRADVLLTADGERLLYDAPARCMTPRARAELVRHKAELLRAVRGPGAAAYAFLLSRVADEGVRDDLAVRFEELAGTLEYDAGLGRDEAEEEACCQLFVELERAAEGPRREPIHHA